MVYTTGNTLLPYNRIRKLLYGKDKKMKEQNHPNVIKIMKRPTISESEDAGGTI